MTNNQRDEIAASKALVAWMQSQDLMPGKAIPVLCRTLVLAVASLCGDGPDTEAGRQDFRKRLEATGRLLPLTAKMMAHEED